MTSQTDTIKGIIGIGASAGGITALKSFIASIPDDTRMTIIIVQHLYPKNTTMMSSILQATTDCPVVEITDGLKVEPGTIYTNVPEKYVQVENGKFRLIDFDDSFTLHMPINILFDSLARTYGSSAVGVIMSGMGHDGTEGMRHIHDAGGLCVAQDPAQTEYRSMPESAINAGITDLVLQTDSMFEEIVSRITIFPREAAPDEDSFNIMLIDLNMVQKILLLIKHGSGTDFFLYKHNTVQRRILRRMSIHRILSIDDYFNLLKSNPVELYDLGRDFLIGVTSFFRDEEVFENLRQTVIPGIIEKASEDEITRLWVCGCSTGEEAYSITILMMEAINESGKNLEFQVFASDINDMAIETARKGEYAISTMGSVPDNLLKRYFTIEHDNYRIKRSVREQIIFAHQNVLQDPPFSRMDFISCRNLLIYLEQPGQEKLLSILRYVLKPQGILLLGTSESLWKFSNSFEVVNSQNRIFRNTESVTSISPGTGFVLPREKKANRHQEVIMKPRSIDSIKHKIEQMLLQSYVPPGILIDENMTIHYFFGDTENFFLPPKGDAVFNCLEMARDHVKSKLEKTIRKALSVKKEIVTKNVKIKTDTVTRLFDIVVKPVPESPDGTTAWYFIIIFRERNHQVKTFSGSMLFKPGRESQLVDLQQELALTKEHLQTTIEELETSNEELKSTNEELQSTNEELQSANEELETSREELQSMNEELVTVNNELKIKVDDYTDANNDITNLLSSIEVSTVFLDIHLNIKRFTPSITKLFNLMETDHGRPLSDFSNSLGGTPITSLASQVLDSLQSYRCDVTTIDDPLITYSMDIRPYRTHENVIEGVVISFFEITEIKMLESQLTSMKHTTSMLLDMSPDAAAVIDSATGIVQTSNSMFLSLLKLDKSKKSGFGYSDILPGDFADFLDKTIADITGTEPQDTDQVFEFKGGASSQPMILTLQSRIDMLPEILITIKTNEMQDKESS
jgi:two-component system CheB/CheR fusion protein